MTKVIEGHTKGKGKRFAIVVSRFNDFVTRRLLEGCLDELSRCGVGKDKVTVVWVPGSFEIPVVALRLAKKKTIDAVICLGAVIRGETPHFEYVARSTSQGIMHAGLSTEKPVIFGVLTTDTVNQAYARSKPKGYNKGREAAQAAVEMTHVIGQLK